MTNMTVQEFLDMALPGGLTYSYQIYDYAKDEIVEDASSINDEFYDFEVVDFDIPESGILTINIDTGEG